MWRKLGIWLWLATQNMADFPDESDKLLSMVEWWELLNLSNDEVEQVNRFRRLSEAQKMMLLSAKKQIRNILKVWCSQPIWKPYSVLFHLVFT